MDLGFVSESEGELKWNKLLGNQSASNSILLWLSSLNSCYTARCPHQLSFLNSWSGKKFLKVPNSFPLPVIWESISSHLSQITYLGFWLHLFPYTDHLLYQTWVLTNWLVFSEFLNVPPLNSSLQIPSFFYWEICSTRFSLLPWFWSYLRQISVNNPRHLDCTEMLLFLKSLRVHWFSTLFSNEWWLITRMQVFISTF
jgi:hypothetical protein